MEAGIQEQVAFYLTGRQAGGTSGSVIELKMKPALFAHYRDLTELRYDFPLVLVDSGSADSSHLLSLSAIFDGMTGEFADDENVDRLTKHALRLEKSIRAAVAEGKSGRLSLLWDKSAGAIENQGDDAIEDSLERLRALLTVDGEAIDCDRETPSRLFTHLWSAVQRQKTDRALEKLNDLILKLSNVLQVDFTHSATGISAENLKSTIGSAHEELFDFDQMSRLLGQTSFVHALPEKRRRRIEQLLSVLKSQRFFGSTHAASSGSTAEERYSYEFSSCSGALQAYRERMTKAVALAEAMEIAELEINSEYDEATHDALFADFASSGLDSRDMAWFPDYLINMSEAQLSGSETDALLEILSSGLPMKVLVQTDDILEQSGIGGDTRVNFASRARALANMAVGLNDVYVLQSSSSHLYSFRDRIISGLSAPGPGLFSVYSGANGNERGIPPYLVAAAAMESRAFPAFTYDPRAGASWADRFLVYENSQPELDWPEQPFSYEVDDHQRVDTSIRFTLADFAACDDRLARHFSPAPHSLLNGSMLQVEDWLGLDSDTTSDKVPGILMVDSENRLHKVVVAETLIDSSKRCRDAWHSLQELGGIHNSHAQRLLERERATWEAAMAQTAPVAAPVTPPQSNGASEPPTDSSISTDSAEVEEEPARSPDEPYVETARCTTCNECTQINNKMFVYDENQQCYIADPDAGTFRELVEAAENCQVAIIHPGKPRNPNEPGLDELIERAADFQ